MVKLLRVAGLLPDLECPSDISGTKWNLDFSQWKEGKERRASYQLNSQFRVESKTHERTTQGQAVARSLRLVRKLMSEDLPTLLLPGCSLREHIRLSSAFSSGLDQRLQSRASGYKSSLQPVQYHEVTSLQAQSAVELSVLQGFSGSQYVRG